MSPMSNNQPDKIPSSTYFLFAYNRLVTKRKSIDKIVEQARDFLRRTGRVVLLSAGIAAVLLFQQGSVALSKESLEQSIIESTEIHPPPPNLLVTEGCNLRPAFGYRWVSDDPAGKQDYRIERIPEGTPCDKYPNVVWAKNDNLRPAPGYRWVDNNAPGDYRVELKPHLVENDDGKIHPADGYRCGSDSPLGTQNFQLNPVFNKQLREFLQPGKQSSLTESALEKWIREDFEQSKQNLLTKSIIDKWFREYRQQHVLDSLVLHIPGTHHNKYPNVVWAENDSFRPAPGYDWASNPPSMQNFRVVHTPGTPHNKHANVVWAENNGLLPAPGYCWVNQDDPEDFRVKWRGYENDLVQHYWESERMNNLFESGRQQYNGRQTCPMPFGRPWH